MLKINAKGLVRSMMGLVLGLSIAASAFAADGGKNRMLDRLQSKLNLTQAQVTQLQPVFDNFRQQQQAERQQMKAKFNSILTPDQQAQLAQAKADNDGKGRHEAFRNLNLTDDQKAQMKSFWQQNGPQMKAEREQFNSQVMAVLTPDQQTQFKEMMQHHHHRHHHRDQNNQ